MFNSATTTSKTFDPKRIFGGMSMLDSQSYTTLFCGPDPADENRILIRKIVKINIGTYAYEETRITRGGPRPVVHTNLTKIHGFDLDEKLSVQEIAIRAMHRPRPQILGFSLYYKPLDRTNHVSIVENSLWKIAGCTWTEWFQAFNDRRDMSAYLSRRFWHLWLFNKLSSLSTSVKANYHYSHVVFHALDVNRVVRQLLCYALEIVLAILHWAQFCAYECTAFLRRQFVEESIRPHQNEFVCEWIDFELSDLWLNW